MTAALAASVAVACACAVRAALRRWMVVRIRGTSMAPTLCDGERVIARRLRPDEAVRRDDIIVFRPPAEATAPGDPAVMVKRVAAAPGDPVPLWAAGLAAWGARVPPGRVIVCGDGKRSVDSRHLGAIARPQIIARVARRPATAATWGRRIEPKEP